MKVLENGKKIVIAAFAASVVLISGIGAMAYVNYSNNNISLKQNEITIELGGILNRSWRKL